jgi:hypothetical protein
MKIVENTRTGGRRPAITAVDIERLEPRSPHPSGWKAPGRITSASLSEPPPISRGEQEGDRQTNAPSIETRRTGRPDRQLPLRFAVDAPGVHVFHRVLLWDGED